MGRVIAKRDIGRELTLWAFAKEAWDKARVESLCLSLQDEHGQSPPLLIWRLWALRERRPLDIGVIENAVAAARRWENAVVRPLRSARLATATGLPVVSAKSRSKLRDSLRAVELEAERALLDALEAITPPPDGRRDDGLSALLELCAIWGSPAPMQDLRQLHAAME